jgi:IS30 family transposase
MKKGKITETESACIKGMLADNLSVEDMAKQLNRTVSVIEKEAKRISEKAVRDQMMITKTARGDGGIVAMTEAASMKTDETRSKPAPQASPERGRWVHTIYDKP